MSESDRKIETNGTIGSGMPLFGFSKIALAGPLGELAERGLARAQEGCEKMKTASEEMAEAMREIYSSNAKTTTDYGLKVMEISRINTTSTLDFFSQLLGSKSMSDVAALSATQARKAFDTTSAQNKELWELAQRLAKDTGEPIRKHFGNIFQQAS
ncbi:phasin family protein [Bradyrhizobium sp. ARR65]|uniref:phasin family protein n=1 Tax=Bradyrhizobium sp. ARR65 TaxID=1040989 RepID=UPI000AB2A306|nr:phasin family protein [Bradyrhizobium sp. ARR65]